jgi:trigger factor
LQAGDVVTGDLQVHVEDEDEVRRRELGPLEIGTDKLVPHIDDHLLGASVGEERRFTVTYPDDYNDQTLRGKNAEFTVTVTSVKEKLLPNVDDELAQAVDAEFATLDALKTRIRERLQANRDATAQIEARKKVVEAVVAGASLELAPGWVERRVEERMQRLLQELTQRSVSLDEYLESQKTTADEVKARFRAEVESDSRRELVLEAIAKKENIQVAADEVEAELAALARTLGQEPRALAERMFRTGSIRALELAVFERKIAEWLLNVANVTYGERPVSGQQ